MKPKDLISETLMLELYFQCWGFSPAWIETIYNAISEFYDGSEDDCCELYRNEACQAIRYRTTNLSKVTKIRRKFIQFANLARKTYIEPDKCFYSIQCA